MKIKFLGSGSAFCFGNYQSNIMVETENKKLLIDCGTVADGFLGFVQKGQEFEF